MTDSDFQSEDADVRVELLAQGLGSSDHQSARKAVAGTYLALYSGTSFMIFKLTSSGS